ncbi:hypothetical protein DIPPA_27837 [Diplonema papillatum]|nr:hypothetical protein DIPPA_27837 [Diplonema papillatum]
MPLVPDEGDDGGMVETEQDILYGLSAYRKPSVHRSWSVCESASSGRPSPVFPVMNSEVNRSLVQMKKEISALFTVLHDAKADASADLPAATGGKSRARSSVSSVHTHFEDMRNQLAREEEALPARCDGAAASLSQRRREGSCSSSRRSSLHVDTAVRSPRFTFRPPHVVIPDASPTVASAFASYAAQGPAHPVALTVRTDSSRTELSAAASLLVSSRRRGSSTVQAAATRWRSVEAATTTCGSVEFRQGGGAASEDPADKTPRAAAAGARPPPPELFAPPAACPDPPQAGPRPPEEASLSDLSYTLPVADNRARAAEARSASQAGADGRRRSLSPTVERPATSHLSPGSKRRSATPVRSWEQSLPTPGLPRASAAAGGQPLASQILPTPIVDQPLTSHLPLVSSPASKTQSLAARRSTTPTPSCEQSLPGIPRAAAPGGEPSAVRHLSPLSSPASKTRFRVLRPDPSPEAHGPSVPRAAAPAAAQPLTTRLSPLSSPASKGKARETASDRRDSATVPSPARDAAAPAPQNGPAARRAVPTVDLPLVDEVPCSSVPNLRHVSGGAPEIDRTAASGAQSATANQGRPSLGNAQKSVAPDRARGGTAGSAPRQLGEANAGPHRENDPAPPAAHRTKSPVARAPKDRSGGEGDRAPLGLPADSRRGSVAKVEPNCENATPRSVSGRVQVTTTELRMSVVNMEITGEAPNPHRIAGLDAGVEVTESSISWGPPPQSACPSLVESPAPSPRRKHPLPTQTSSPITHRSTSPDPPAPGSPKAAPPPARAHDASPPVSPASKPPPGPGGGVSRRVSGPGCDPAAAPMKAVSSKSDQDRLSKRNSLSSDFTSPPTEPHLVVAATTRHHHHHHHHHQHPPNQHHQQQSNSGPLAAAARRPPADAVERQADQRHPAAAGLALAEQDLAEAEGRASELSPARPPTEATDAAGAAPFFGRTEKGQWEGDGATGDRATPSQGDIQQHGSGASGHIDGAKPQGDDGGEASGNRGFAGRRESGDEEAGRVNRLTSDALLELQDMERAAQGATDPPTVPNSACASRLATRHVERRTVTIEIRSTTRRRHRDRSRDPCGTSEEDGTEQTTSPSQRQQQTADDEAQQLQQQQQQRHDPTGPRDPPPRGGPESKLSGAGAEGLGKQRGSGAGSGDATRPRTSGQDAAAERREILLRQKQSRLYEETSHREDRKESIAKQASDGEAARMRNQDAAAERREILLRQKQTKLHEVTSYREDRIERITKHASDGDVTRTRTSSLDAAAERREKLLQQKQSRLHEVASYREDRYERTARWESDGDATRARTSSQDAAARRRAELLEQKQGKLREASFLHDRRKGRASRRASADDTGLARASSQDAAAERREQLRREKQGKLREAGVSHEHRRETVLRPASAGDVARTRAFSLDAAAERREKLLRQRQSRLREASSLHEHRRETVSRRASADDAGRVRASSQDAAAERREQLRRQKQSKLRELNSLHGRRPARASSSEKDPHPRGSSLEAAADRRSRLRQEKQRKLHEASSLHEHRAARASSSEKDPHPRGFSLEAAADRRSRLRQEKQRKLHEASSLHEHRAARASSSEDLHPRGSSLEAAADRRSLLRREKQRKLREASSLHERRAARAPPAGDRGAARPSSSLDAAAERREALRLRQQRKLREAGVLRERRAARASSQRGASAEAAADRRGRLRLQEQQSMRDAGLRGSPPTPAERPRPPSPAAAVKLRHQQERRGQSPAAGRAQARREAATAARDAFRSEQASGKEKPPRPDRDAQQRSIARLTARDPTNVGSTVGTATRKRAAHGASSCSSAEEDDGMAFSHGAGVNRKARLLRQRQERCRDRNAERDARVAAARERREGDRAFLLRADLEGTDPLNVLKHRGGALYAAEEPSRAAQPWSRSQQAAATRRKASERRDADFAGTDPQNLLKHRGSALHEVEEPSRAAQPWSRSQQAAATRRKTGYRQDWDGAQKRAGEWQAQEAAADRRRAQQQLTRDRARETRNAGAGEDDDSDYTREIEQQLQVRSNSQKAAAERRRALLDRKSDRARETRTRSPGAAEDDDNSDYTREIEHQMQTRSNSQKAAAERRRALLERKSDRAREARNRSPAVGEDDDSDYTREIEQQLQTRSNSQKAAAERRRALLERKSGRAREARYRGTPGAADSDDDGARDDVVWHLRVRSNSQGAAEGRHGRAQHQGPLPAGEAAQRETGAYSRHARERKRGGKDGAADGEAGRADAGRRKRAPELATGRTLPQRGWAAEESDSPPPTPERLRRFRTAGDRKLRLLEERRNRVRLGRREGHGHAADSELRGFEAFASGGEAGDDLWGEAPVAPRRQQPRAGRSPAINGGYSRAEPAGAASYAGQHRRRNRGSRHSAAEEARAARTPSPVLPVARERAAVERIDAEYPSADPLDRTPNRADRVEVRRNREEVHAVRTSSAVEVPVSEAVRQRRRMVESKAQRARAASVRRADDEQTSDGTLGSSDDSYDPIRGYARLHQKRKESEASSPSKPNWKQASDAQALLHDLAGGKLHARSPTASERRGGDDKSQRGQCPYSLSAALFFDHLQHPLHRYKHMLARRDAHAVQTADEYRAFAPLDAQDFAAWQSASLDTLACMRDETQAGGWAAVPPRPWDFHRFMKGARKRLRIVRKAREREETLATHFRTPSGRKYYL